MWTPDEKVTIATATLTNMDESFKLDFWQEWFLKHNKKFLILNKSRRIGYSWVSSLDSNINANDPSIYKFQQVFVSYGMQDAMGKISDARAAYMNMPEAWRKELSSDSKTALEFWDKGKKSKSQILSLPNRTLRGFGTTNDVGGIVLDEFCFHRDDDKVYESALPCLSRGGRLSIGSTPLAKSGKFYEILSDSDKYSSYTRLTIPWYWSNALCLNVKEAINNAPKMDIWSRVEQYGTDIVKEIFNSMPLVSFRQEYECEFTDESMAFISLDMILSCTPQKVEQYEYQNLSELLSGINLPEICTGIAPSGEPILESVYAPPYEPGIHGVLYAGLDIGRSKDASIFTLLGKRNGKMHLWMSYEMKNMAFDEQRAFIESVMGSLPIHRLLIDSTGLGIEFGEWAEKKFPTKAEGVVFNNERKETMANKVYLAFQRLEYVLPMNRALHADIHCIRKTSSATGKSRYDGSTKDSHADRFWSLALATLGIEDGSAESRFYKGYSKKVEKIQKTTKKASTGIRELDRILRKAGRRR